jgi:hypothetical protein
LEGNEGGTEVNLERIGKMEGRKESNRKGKKRGARKGSKERP